MAEDELVDDEGGHSHVPGTPVTFPSQFRHILGREKGRRSSRSWERCLGRWRNKIIRWLKRCRNNRMRKEIILGLKVQRNLERLKVIWYVLCIIVIVHIRGDLMKGRNRMRKV